MSWAGANPGMAGGPMGGFGPGPAAAGIGGTSGGYGVGGPGNTGNSGAVGGVASGGIGGLGGVGGPTSGGAQAAAGPGGVGSGHAGMGPGGVGGGGYGGLGNMGGGFGGQFGGAGTGPGVSGPGMGGGFGGQFGGDPNSGPGMNSGSAVQSNKGDYGGPSIGSPGGPASVGRPAVVGGIPGMMSDFGFTPNTPAPRPGSTHAKNSPSKRGFVSDQEVAKDTTSRNFNKDQSRFAPPVSLNEPKAWPRDYLENPFANVPPGMRKGPSVSLPHERAMVENQPAPQTPPSKPSFPGISTPPSSPPSTPGKSPFAGWDSTIDKAMDAWGQLSGYFAGQRARRDFAEGRRGAGLGVDDPQRLAELLRNYGGGGGR